MLLILAGLMGLGVSQLFPYPFHASCKIEWESSNSCSEVRNKIQDQIFAWSQNSCPNVSDSCPQLPCGQKCNYKIVDDSQSSELKSLHVTPQKKYTDYQTFTFKDRAEGQGCKFQGYSDSGVWYAILDFSTNYCNLRNLIDGARISEEQGFKEVTSNSVCTQYSSRNCERY